MPRFVEPASRKVQDGLTDERSRLDRASLMARALYHVLNRMAEMGEPVPSDAALASAGFGPDAAAVSSLIDSLVGLGLIELGALERLRVVRCVRFAQRRVTIRRTGRHTPFSYSGRLPPR